MKTFEIELSTDSHSRSVTISREAILTLKFLVCGRIPKDNPIRFELMCLMNALEDVAPPQGEKP